MKFEELIQQIDRGQFAPIYLLHGEEPFFIDRLSELLQKKVLTEQERAFNETIAYGEDADVVNIIHAAKRYPMGAARQLVMVREAQRLDNFELLESYFEVPQPSTVLVLCHKYKLVDKRLKAYKVLQKQKQAVVFESNRLRDYQMGPWVADYLKSRGLTIEPRASQLLIDSLGESLEKVAQAVDKLVVAMGPGAAQITVEQVSRNVGISKEYNVFELQDALVKKDVLKANRIVRYFAANPKAQPLPMITGALFSFFSKLLGYYYLKDKSKAAVASQLKVNPYFVDKYQMAAKNYTGVKVAQIISILREYDMKSKGFGNTGTPDGELLQEMVFKILH